MFDISWTEFLLIGVVALIVIGPKELPGLMRTLGQWTRKLRSMAGDFQNQFQEAMREAEMTDLKKEVDDMAQGIKDGITKYDPLKDVRADVESLGKDFEKSLDSASGQKAAEEKTEELKSDPGAPVALLPDAGGEVTPVVQPAPTAAEPAVVAATAEPATLAAEPDSRERTG
jgi:sec-independent protein translocase protein TatB